MLNSVITLYKTSLPKESQVFFKYMNSWCTIPFSSHLFSNISRNHIWSVVDLVRRHPHWWYPIIPSVYGVKLNRRMLDRILYAADKSSDIYRVVYTHFWVSWPYWHEAIRCHGRILPAVVSRCLPPCTILFILIGPLEPSSSRSGDSDEKWPLNFAYETSLCP
jgi:hypothetical protein